jgi:nitrate/nitrite transporter NarK
VNYQIENKDMDGSLKRTIAVSLTNYLDAGAIVAGASGLTLWQKYLGLSEVHLGWLNFISANCLGAALGAIIGGVLADKYGRKFIYTYNLIVYMVGVLLILCSVNFPMLLAGFQEIPSPPLAVPKSCLVCLPDAANHSRRVLSAPVRGHWW